MLQILVNMTQPTQHFTTTTCNLFSKKSENILYQYTFKVTKKKRKTTNKFFYTHSKGILLLKINLQSLLTRKFSLISVQGT